MQIRLHELKHQVQILLVFGLNHPIKLHNIVLVELLQDGHFAVGALCVDRVTECVEYLLQCVTLVCALLFDFPYMAVCTTAHLLH